MRKYIIVALVLVVAGVTASFFLIPSDSDVVVMQTKDVQTLDLGNVDIEAEYAQGRRNFPIISALADKRIAGGDRPAAIALWEDYVKSSPADVQGRKKLAEQYMLAGRNADYNVQLEAIAAADPSETNLRVLADIYNSSKDYAKQAEVLKKMIAATAGSKPQIFVDLATIQVALNDQEGAFKTVEELKAKHPTFSNYQMTRLMVSALAGKGDVDRAFQVAKEWMATPNAPVPAAAPGVPPTATATDADPRPKELADFCNILHYSGHADKALALVEPHLDMLQREPELVVAYVNANITAGRSDHAYDVLKRIDEAGRMTPALYPPYLELAIKREDIPAAETIANKLDVAAFNEEQALNIIELARVTNATTVLSTLTSRFNTAPVLEGKPVLSAVIAILTNTKDQDRKIETALNTQLSSTQRIRLAESCARTKKTACFDAILKQFPTLDTMSPQQIAEYAQLFIIAERAPEIVDAVTAKAAEPNSHADVQTASRRLAAASGRLDILKPWLEANANSAPIGQLQELFYLANNRKHGDVASDIAERLYARDPSPMNREIMTIAYITAGKLDKAVALLREQVKEPGSNDSLYVSTLSQLSRSDAAARKELADYAEVALRSNKGDSRQQLNYAYVLINQGRKDVVIPFAKAYATERGGEWKKMYQQLTQKAGAGAPVAKLSREQMIAMANSKSISAANKRQMAFGLLNDGHKADATKVFMDLAKDKGPDSQEVKDLMYLWGGKLNAEQLTWVSQRAASANAYDKGRWAELISNTGDDRAVLNYVSATPDALYNQSLRKKYFTVLAQTGSRQNYDTSMRNWVAQTTDVPALSDYASIAQAFNYRDAAIAGYRRVLVLDPSNANALNQVAALDFSKGKYAEADQNLNRYLNVQAQRPDASTNPAQAHFYKAELLRREGNMAGAQQEYAQVVAKTPVTASTPVDALSRLYTVKFRMGQHAEAKAGFERLLAANPDNKGVLGDYMSMLIEFKYLEDATRVANQYDKTSPYYGRGASIQGKSANVSSIERLSNGREMKISFAQPIEGKAPISVAQAKKLAWVEDAHMGYDSMTISAKPGYVVRYVPTAQESFAVVAAAAPEYAPQVEAQRQQDLRLQLLYAQIEQETGQADRAKQRLAALRQYYPQDPQLLTMQASLENASGNRDGAIELLQQAQAKSPENEDLARMMRSLTNAGESTGSTGSRNQYVKLDHEYRNYGSNNEQITTLSGVARVTSNAEIGAVLTNNFISPDAIRNPSTGAITDDEATRQTGELFLGYYLGDGSRAQASVFSNTKSVGGGLYYAFDNALGRSELIGEYHKPYADFPEAAYAYANRDRVGARHYANLTPTTSFGAEVSGNNYNVDVMDNVFSTVLARMSITQQLQPETEHQPWLGVGYGFDGEYLLDKPETRTVGATTYRPLDFATREVHQISGIYRQNWTPTTHALLSGGWVYDRYGENGPVADGRITQDLTDDVELGVRGRYSRVNSNSDGDAVNVGAHLMYKF